MSGKNDACISAFWRRSISTILSTAPHCSRIAGIAILLLLNACAVGPDFVRPAAPAVDRYTREVQAADGVAANGQAQRFVSGEKIAADWWRLFNSPALDGAVKQAIVTNASLQSAQASLRQSQANLQAGYGVFYPQIDARFSAARQKTSPLLLGLNSVGSIFNLFTLNTIISYTLDLFGGQRRTVEAVGAQEDFERYTMLATYLTLSGNVVNTMIARAAYLAQIDATQHLIVRQQDQLAIAQAQASAGTVPYSSILSIQSQLAATQATLPTLQQKSDQAEHLLASLLGRTPAEWNPPAIELKKLSLPSDLPVSLPSDLVRQRPDILAAEEQLHAASAGIGVATAALFPTFSLNGNYGGNGTTIGAVGDPNTRFWNVGPTIDFPLFQGGAAWYRRRAAIEGYQKSLADYRQTVLNAFVQVADTLKALEHDAQSLQAQSEALQTAEQALTLVEANYRAGITGYLNVLAADVQLNQSNVNYLQALAQRYQDTVALFVALGGGWWNGVGPQAASPLSGTSARQGVPDQ